LLNIIVVPDASDEFHAEKVDRSSLQEDEEEDESDPVLPISLNIKVKTYRHTHMENKTQTT
jgi:hypothetical protein